MFVVMVPGNGGFDFFVHSHPRKVVHVQVAEQLQILVVLKPVADGFESHAGYGDMVFAADDFGDTGVKERPVALRRVILPFPGVPVVRVCPQRIPVENAFDVVIKTDPGLNPRKYALAVDVIIGPILPPGGEAAIIPPDVFAERPTFVIFFDGVGRRP